MDYPGVHGAPDLSGTAHYGKHAGIMPLGPQPYTGNGHEPAVAEHMMAPYRQNQPGVTSLDGRTHRQAHSRGSESKFLHSRGPYSPVQSEPTTDQVLRLPRGQAVINRKSNFEEVKHVAPPTLAEALGQSNAVSWDPQGHNKPLSFVYSEHDLVVEEAVPNRRDMFASRPSLPQSRGRGAYRRGSTGYGLGRKEPVLSSSSLPDKDHVRGMMSGRPAVSRPGRIRLSGQNLQQFVRGNPVIRHMPKLKSGPVRMQQ